MSESVDSVERVQGMSASAPEVTFAAARAAEVAAPRQRWRPHIGVRLLIVAIFLGALIGVKTPGALLVETLALLALTSWRRRPGLFAVGLLSGLGLETLAALAPGGPAALSATIASLALPVGWEQAAEAALAQAPAYAPPALLLSAALGSAKLVAISLAIAWFGALTDASELLDFFSALSLGIPGLRSPLYILSTLLATLPTIQSDLRKSLDAAIVRGGGREALLRPGVWAGALADVIVRVALRSKRLAASAVARGFRLSDGLTPIAARVFTVADGLLIVGALGAGGLFVLLVMGTK